MSEVPWRWPFSGSNAERSLLCPASTILPRVERAQIDESREGIAVHVFLEYCSSHNPDKALRLIEESARYSPWLDICEAIDVAALPTELAHEVAFAYNLETGKARELGRGINRAYVEHGLLPGEVPLTIDIVGVSPDAVFVADYKTGRAKVTDAIENVQVGLGAICAAQCYDRDAAIVEIIKPGKNGAKPYRDRAELDAWDLDELAARFRAWPARATAARETTPTPVTTGYHCRYCDSYEHCPAKTALAVRMGNGSEIEEMQTALTRETAGQVYLRAKAAKVFLSKIFDAIYGMAAQQPIEFSEGQFLGMQTKKGNEKLDGSTVYDVVSELHGAEVANAAVKLTATKTAIERALRGNVAKIAPSMREILTATRKRGGSQRVESTKVCEYKADK